MNGQMDVWMDDRRITHLNGDMDGEVDGGTITDESAGRQADR